MSEVKVEINYKAVGELLKSQDLADQLKSLADGVANRAGEGYGSDVKVMGTRVIASAYAATKDASKDNLENNTLLKALR